MLASGHVTKLENKRICSVNSFFLGGYVFMMQLLVYSFMFIDIYPLVSVFALRYHGFACKVDGSSSIIAFNQLKPRIHKH